MFCFYILSSLSGTLYIGLRDDPARRVSAHKLGLVDSPTQKIEVNRLMCFQTFRKADNAAARKRQLKKWSWDPSLRSGLKP